MRRTAPLVPEGGHGGFLHLTLPLHVAPSIFSSGGGEGRGEGLSPPITTTKKSLLDERRARPYPHNSHSLPINMCAPRHSSEKTLKAREKTLSVRGVLRRLEDGFSHAASATTSASDGRRRRRTSEGLLRALLFAVFLVTSLWKRRKEGKFTQRIVFLLPPNAGAPAEEAALPEDGGGPRGHCGGGSSKGAGRGRARRRRKRSLIPFDLHD